jgi:hypothetical protein
MTPYERFLARLRWTPRDWQMPMGIICRRGTSGRQCPLSAIADLTSSRAWDVGNQLGIPLLTQHRIVRAADNASPHSKRIRADLLAACGLSESDA